MRAYCMCEENNKIYCHIINYNDVLVLRKYTRLERINAII